jgi:cell division protein FtsB
MGSSEGGEEGRFAPPLPDEFGRLERLVRRMADEIAGYRARVEVAEARARELERALKDMQSGGLDPLSQREVIRKLQDENRDLRRTVHQARERVRTLISRFDFLREEL